MKNIYLISTGGTIACVPTDNGLKPELSARELLNLVRGETLNCAGSTCEGAKQCSVFGNVHCVDLFSMDSSNIQPEEWITIAEAINQYADKCDGIVLTHGTDTMAYTASMLSFMLAGIRIPVVLTGAQYPAVYPDSDGRRNLENAIIAATALTGGVYICFGNSLMLGLPRRKNAHNIAQCV